ncbi:PEP/pyruvate-binding domain-containing protein [Nocardiopsis sp. CNR-923]|uniref:PEP/pyruvate-binding domain-containing protein n=1 Tax=Nocardiopsis sp. CNR-923 TaxID=1904965 RepID=UPI00373FDF5A
MTQPPSVAPLDAFGADDLAAVGGKAANLAELLRAGLPVPPGFVVTTDAYARAAAGVGLPDRLAAESSDDRPSQTPDPAGLRAALEAAPVPDDLRAAITRAYTGLGADAPVAVRSSATAEDLPGATFAGQQDTYLNVVGADAVVDAVRRCWASLWTDRAVAYRAERSAPSAQVRIAVVVQRMVDSDVAGVMFTADPVSGERDRVIVDAGAGLGEAVVSGLVTPDHYVLDHGGRLLEWRPGRGEVVIRSGAGGGVVREDRTGQDQRGTRDADAERLLTDDQLSVLVAHARTIAAHFGRPQDIEWCLADGRAHIVQSRPMTALPPVTGPLNRRQRLLASVLTEYVPVRPYPMDASTWFGRGPARMMGQIAQAYGITGGFDDFYAEEDGVVTRLTPGTPRPTPRALGTPFLLARAARARDVRTWREDPRFVDFLRRTDELDALDPASLPWPELVAVPERVLALLDTAGTCAWTTCRARGCRWRGWSRPPRCSVGGPCSATCSGEPAPGPRTPTGRSRTWRTGSGPRPHCARSSSPPTPATCWPRRVTARARGGSSPRPSTPSCASSAAARPPARCWSARPPSPSRRRASSDWSGCWSGASARTTPGPGPNARWPRSWTTRCCAAGAPGRW